MRCSVKSMEGESAADMPPEVGAFCDRSFVSAIKQSARPPHVSPGNLLECPDFTSSSCQIRLKVRMLFGRSMANWRFPSLYSTSGNKTIPPAQGFFNDGAGGVSRE